MLIFRFEICVQKRILLFNRLCYHNIDESLRINKLKFFDGIHIDPKILLGDSSQECSVSHTKNHVNDVQHS